MAHLCGGSARKTHFLVSNDTQDTESTYLEERVCRVDHQPMADTLAFATFVILIASTQSDLSKNFEEVRIFSVVITKDFE